MTIELQLDVRNLNWWWRHLLNAYKDVGLAEINGNLPPGIT